MLVRGEIDQPAQAPRGICDGAEYVAGGDRCVVVRASATGTMDDKSGQHPLTARVMVNRIWQHLLGSGIVREPEELWCSGPGPTHAELLDYLAVRFVGTGWSVKTIVREIATSHVYRLSSEFDKVRFEKDPDNLYFARAEVRRMDANQFADAMLAASGQLDTKRPEVSTISRFGLTLIGPNGPAMLPLADGTAGDSPRRPSAMNGIIAAAEIARAVLVCLIPVCMKHRSVYLPVP